MFLVERALELGPRDFTAFVVFDLDSIALALGRGPTAGPAEHPPHLFSETHVDRGGKARRYGGVWCRYVWKIVVI